MLGCSGALEQKLHSGTLLLVATAKCVAANADVQLHDLPVSVQTFLPA